MMSESSEHVAPIGVDVVSEQTQVSGADPRDRAHWGPVWAGLVTTLATFLLLELLFFTFGWLTLVEADNPGPSSSVAWMTGLAGAIAFLFGGACAGATAASRKTMDGLLHGMLVWALGTVSIVLIALLGGAGLFGAFSDVLGRLSGIRTRLPRATPTSARRRSTTPRDVAEWAVLALVVYLAMAAAGGLIGAKTTPKREDGATVDWRRDAVIG